MKWEYLSSRIDKLSTQPTDSVTALLWLADKVDDQVDSYRAAHDIRGTWEARERVADRTKGADLLAVHVARSDSLIGADPAHLARQRALVESLGGTCHQVVGDDTPTALLDFARGVNATQLVLGASRRGRLAQLLSRGVGVTATVLSGPIGSPRSRHTTPSWALSTPPDRPMSTSASPRTSRTCSPTARCWNGCWPT